MRQIKNVVFDFGGVIIDIDRDRAVKKFVEIGVWDYMLAGFNDYYKN